MPLTAEPSLRTLEITLTLLLLNSLSEVWTHHARAHREDHRIPSSSLFSPFFCLPSRDPAQLVRLSQQTLLPTRPSALPSPWEMTFVFVKLVTALIY